MSLKNTEKACLTVKKERDNSACGIGKRVYFLHESRWLCRPSRGKTLVIRENVASLYPTREKVSYRIDGVVGELPSFQSVS